MVDSLKQITFICNIEVRNTKQSQRNICNKIIPKRERDELPLRGGLNFIPGIRLERLNANGFRMS